MSGVPSWLWLVPIMLVVMTMAAVCLGGDRLAIIGYAVVDVVDSVLEWMFPQLRVPQLPISDEDLEWFARPLNEIWPTDASATSEAREALQGIELRAEEEPCSASSLERSHRVGAAESAEFASAHSEATNTSARSSDGTTR